MDPVKRLEKIGQFRMVMGLSRMRRIMDSLDSPQLKVPSVHIAGTNGKGSTAIMLDSILSGFDIRRGLYTSPHLESVTERIVFDGEMISEEALSSVLERIFRITDQWEEDDRPTYFEVLTAAFFLLSFERGTGMNIVEVGLGGRHDATNVIEPMAASIISISLDHQEHLGEDDFLIAREKAGIITPSTPVVLGPIHLDGGTRALKNILDICTFNGCPVVMVTPPGHSDSLGKMMYERSIPDGRILEVTDKGDKVLVNVIRLVDEGSFSDRLDIIDKVMVGDFLSPLTGVEQKYNLCCAISLSLLSLPGGYSYRQVSRGRREALDDLIECSTEPFLGSYPPAAIRKKINQALESTYLRGRMEYVGPDLIFDCAHNQSSARSLSGSLGSIYPSGKGCLLLSMMKDKDPLSFLGSLSDVISSVVVTEVDSPRAMKARDMASVISASDLSGIELYVEEDLEKAVEMWTEISSRSEFGLATGSFYLYSPLIDILKKTSEPNV